MERRYQAWMRYPRTQQERREAGDKHNPYVRAKRRANRLPTSYDDQFVSYEKSWKSRRKTRYHADNSKFAWREYRCERYCWRSSRPLEQQLYEKGYFFYYDYRDFEYKYICWYGPEI